MSVSRAARKQEIKDELHRQLLEAAVFSEQTHERSGYMELAAEAIQLVRITRYPILTLKSRFN